MGWQFVIQFLPIVVLLVLGFTVGGLVERAHFRRLQAREARLRHIFVTDISTLPPGAPAELRGMVSGQVVIAADYFKSFAAGLRKLIGGDLRTYETLLERARREAIVRMLESADRLDANQIINVRLATSNIGSSSGRRRKLAAMAEVYAYGTAVYVPAASPG